MILAEFAEAVAHYCALTGASVTSWWRSPPRNMLVGGHPQSRHQVGLAVDVVYAPNHRPGTAEQTARELDLWLLREKDHDHLEPLAFHRTSGVT